MNEQMKLSEQEIKVLDYLTARNNSVVYWEELAQFAKNPQTVKLKTIKKTVSEIKRKYATLGAPVPFSVEFNTMGTENESEEVTDIQPINLDMLVPVEQSKPQTLVQIKRTTTSLVPTSVQSTPLTATVVLSTSNVPAAHTDFVLDRNTKRVKTKFGSHLLNDNEWEMFKYLHNNTGRVIDISELRDKVVYPQYGSKLPPRWFDSIKRIIGNLRAQIPSLKDRLRTVKGTETGYLFQ
jgi:hypothetical protein